jgi:hypothetical protein
MLTNVDKTLKENFSAWAAKMDSKFGISPIGEMVPRVVTDIGQRDKNHIRDLLKDGYRFQFDSKKVAERIIQERCLIFQPRCFMTTKKVVTMKSQNRSLKSGSLT